MAMSNKEKINTTINLVDEMVTKLNHNYKVIKNINKNYNEKIAICISFYIINESSCFNNELRNLLTGELTQIIKHFLPFATDEMIHSYYNDLLIESISKGKREYISNYIDKLFIHDFSREKSTAYEYLQKYIIFDGKEFKQIDNYQETIKQYYSK